MVNVDAMINVQKTKVNLFSLQYHLFGEGLIFDDIVQLKDAKDLVLCKIGMRIDSKDGVA